MLSIIFNASDHMVQNFDGMATHRSQNWHSKRNPSKLLQHFWVMTDFIKKLCIAFVRKGLESIFAPHRKQVRKSFIRSLSRTTKLENRSKCGNRQKHMNKTRSKKVHADDLLSINGKKSPKKLYENSNYRLNIKGRNALSYILYLIQYRFYE